MMSRRKPATEWSARAAVTAAVGGLLCLAGCAGTRQAQMAEQFMPEIDIVKLHDDAAKALAAIDELRAELQKVSGARSSGASEADRARIAALERRVADLEARLPKQAQEQDVTTTQPPQPDVGRDAPQPQSEGELYQRALDAFRAKDYGRSLRVLQAMLSAYPDGTNAENGHYWSGECLFGLQRYEQAVTAFETVLSMPGHAKDDDAQLKLGVCYIKLKRTDDARRAFTVLVEQYPSSEHVRRARSYLRKMGG